MADIYDLIQQGLAERRAGASTFRDPLIDVALQVPQWIAGERDKALVRENQAITDFATLVPLANTEEGIDNLLSQLGGLSVNSQNQPKYDILNNVLTNRKAQYDDSLKYVQEVYDSYSAKSAVDDKYRWNRDEILSGGMKNISEYGGADIYGEDVYKDGVLVSKGKLIMPSGKSGLEYLTQETNNIALVVSHLENAKKNSFNYRKFIGDMPIDQLLEKAKTYQGMLKEAWAAVPGGITPEEATAIMFADYSVAQKDKLSQIDKKALKNSDQITRLRNFIDATTRTRENYQQKKIDEAEKNASIAGYMQQYLHGTEVEIDVDEAAETFNIDGAINSAKNRINAIVTDNQDLEDQRIFWGYTGFPLDETKSGGIRVPSGLYTQADSSSPPPQGTQGVGPVVQQGAEPGTYGYGAFSSEDLETEYTKNSDELTALQSHVSNNPNMDETQTNLYQNRIEELTNRNNNISEIKDTRAKEIESQKSEDTKKIQATLGVVGPVSPDDTTIQIQDNDGNLIETNVDKNAIVLNNNGVNVNPVGEPISVEDEGDGFEIPDRNEVETGINDWTFMGIDFSNPNVAVPAGISTIAVSNWMWGKSESARKHMMKMLNTTDESKLINFVRDGDMLDDMMKIDKVSEKIKVLEQKIARGATKTVIDPVTQKPVKVKQVHSYNIKSYKDKLIALEKAFAEKYGIKHNFTNQDMVNLIKSRDKWNIWKLKSAIMPVLREVNFTAKDMWSLIKSKGLGRGKNPLGMRAFWALAPFQGGIMLADKLGADGIIPQLATGIGLQVVTTQVRNKLIKKYVNMTAKEITEHLANNPKARGKVLTYLGKFGVKLGAKATAKGGAGMVLSGIGTAIPPAGPWGIAAKAVVSGIGWGLTAWAAKDVYDIGKMVYDFAQDNPEVYQLMYEDADPNSMELSPEVEFKANEILQKLYGASVFDEYQKTIYGREGIDTQEFSTKHNLTSSDLSFLDEAAEIGQQLDDANEKLEQGDFKPEDKDKLLDEISVLQKRHDEQLNAFSLTVADTKDEETAALEHYGTELSDFNFENWERTLDPKYDVIDTTSGEIIKKATVPISEKAPVSTSEKQTFIDGEKVPKGTLLANVKIIVDDYRTGDYLKDIMIFDKYHRGYDKKGFTRDESVYNKIRSQVGSWAQENQNHLLTAKQDKLLTRYLIYMGIPNIKPGDKPNEIELKIRNANDRRDTVKANKILKEIGELAKGLFSSK